MIEMNKYDNHITLKCSVSVFDHGSLVDRGVVVRRRRSGKYFGVGTAFRQISLATGGMLTLKCSGKSRRTR